MYRKSRIMRDVSTLSLEPEEHAGPCPEREEHTPHSQPQRKKLSVKDLPDLTGPAERGATVPLQVCSLYWRSRWVFCAWG